MIIAHPPLFTGPPAEARPNLLKQEQVALACYDPTQDELLLPEPASLGLLSHAHAPDWAHDVLSGTRPTGFGPRLPAVVAHAQASVAALTAAAGRAVACQDRLAFAPVSGFHHAGYRYNGAFCTFNGLVVAAAEARRLNQLDRVLIIDGDEHHGDGTVDIIEQLGLSWLTNLSLARGSHDLSNDDLFRRNQLRIDDALAAEPDLVLYQAGADAHLADPYGAGYLDHAAWVARDCLVFSACRELGLPLVWCLAGGYNGVKTHNLHVQTFQTALDV